MIFAVKMIVINLIFMLNLQVADGNDLLQQLQNKYSSIEDFTASFKQSTSGGKQLTGKFYYKSKDKFRIELDNRTLVSDGESIWNYSKNNKKVIITPVEDNSNSFSINDYVFEYPKECIVKQFDNEDGTKTLWFKPKNANLDFKEVKLIINSKNLIDQIDLTDLMDQTFKVNLTDTKINQNLSSELFTFETSEGMQVIDLR